MKLGKMFWFLLSINLFVSILLPIGFFNIINGMNAQEALCFGFITFSMMYVVEMYIYVSLIYSKDKKEDNTIQLNDESDKILFNVMQNMHKVNSESYGEYDLFTFYLKKKLDIIDELSRDAVNKHEIRIEDNMIEVTKEMYYSAFNGDQHSIFMPMYDCRDNDFFFDGFGKDYFKLAKELVDKKKIKRVKRLFVYQYDNELMDERIKKLIYFHNKTRYYECKVLSLNRYNQIKNSFNLTDVSGTFAVYGSKYLYTERIAPTVQKQVGYYSKDKNSISNYISFFDQCWKAAKEHEITSNKNITVNDIFDSRWLL